MDDRVRRVGGYAVTMSIHNVSAENESSLVLLHTSTLTRELQKKLMEQLGCSTMPWQPPEEIKAFSKALWLDDSNTLQLQTTGNKNTGKISVDFTCGAVDHRRQFGGGKGQAIAKAMGIQDTKHPLRVLDCTAGLGRDAFVLAALGCHVTLLERSSVVTALLENGLQKAEKDSRISAIVQRMSLQTISAHDYLKKLSETTLHEPAYDVIYLDPMFPHKSKSAAVKKEMQYLQSLLSSDEDADLLLPLALQHARYRVVVKRPRIAPDLNNTSPNYRLKGKSNRFDIYTLKSLKKS